MYVMLNKNHENIYNFKMKAQFQVDQKLSIKQHYQSQGNCEIGKYRSVVAHSKFYFIYSLNKVNGQLCPRNSNFLRFLAFSKSVSDLTLMVD